MASALNPHDAGVTMPAPDSERGRAARVGSYLLNYGPWTDEAIAQARRHQLVIAHPSSGRLTAEIVSRIRGSELAPAEQTLVICYVSIGEDLRTTYLTDEEARSDQRLTGDRSGPRVDPRGPAAGRPLQGVDPAGAPSPGGNGFASWYLDDNSVTADGTGDGVPDRNPASRAYYVNAGHPGWFDVLRSMTMDSPDAVAGFDEVLGTRHGRGLGCDGVLLDTVDTAAPNSYTEPGTGNMTRFEWTAPGVSAMVARLRHAYPDKVIVQNRGLFYFDARHPHYAFTTRGPIDMLLFESYRLDASADRQYDQYTYADNRFNTAPRVMAEANRPDGFRVLSLGYAVGPPDQVSADTLRGLTQTGFETLMEDFRVARAAGFVHTVSNTELTLVHSFALDQVDMPDTEPPAWTSTTNDRAPGWPAVPSEPTPRVGVRNVVPGKHRVTVRWDVALDQHPVRYVLYYQALPFDFGADPDLSESTRVPLRPAVPAEYQAGTPGSYPHEATVAGLESGKGYYLVIRAVDGSEQQREDRNTIVGFGRPL